MKNKLIELLRAGEREFEKECRKHFECKECSCFIFGYSPNCLDALTADYLIANGVTIQRWIPVKEKLPEELPESHPAWSDDVRPSKDVLVKRKGIRSLVVAWYSFTHKSWMEPDEFFEFDDVEYWQELSEPPKEEA